MGDVISTFPVSVSVQLRPIVSGIGRQHGIGLTVVFLQCSIEVWCVFHMLMPRMHPGNCRIDWSTSRPHGINRVLTDMESWGINLVGKMHEILLMVREKWCVSPEFRDCCLFLLKKWKYTFSACFLFLLSPLSGKLNWRWVCTRFLPCCSVFCHISHISDICIMHS